MRLVNLCIPVHAYGTLKGRPRVLRSVHPLLRFTQGLHPTFFK